MQKKFVMTGLAATAVLLGALTTVALAERGGHGMGMGMGGGMPPFAEVDADGDGKVTEAELNAWRTAQTTGADADGDGFLSKEEVKAAMQRRMAAQADRMVEGMFAARDSDGDGKLSAAEAMMPAAPARMFDRIDADNDGAITEAEIEAAHDRMAERGRHGPRHGKPPMFGIEGDDN